MTNKRATYNVDLEKKLMIERLAINVSLKVGRTVKWTDIMEHLIVCYAKEAADDLALQKNKSNEILLNNTIK